MSRSVLRISMFLSFTLAAATLAGCPAPAPGLKTPDRDRIRQAQIDAGEYNLFELIRFGRDFSLMGFDKVDGYGNGRNGATPPNFSRLVGPDSSSCNSCHGLSGIVMGWGTSPGNVLVEFDDPIAPTVAGSNERQPPMVQGAVYLELLSKEMSLDLRAIREDAIFLAERRGVPVTRILESKGVHFGTITAFPDGSVDTAAMEGCDADMRIRPFHQKGMASSIRIFARGALERHFGIQSMDLLRKLDPTKDPLTWDEDQDGVVDEFSEAELTALTLFCAGLPAPVETATGDFNVEAGRVLMDSFGCTACHIPYLRLENPTFHDVSSTGTEIAMDLLDPFLGTPRLKPQSDGSVLIPAWTDLKRHDIGPESHEPLDQPQDNTLPNWDGGARGETMDEALTPIPRQQMLTMKLWGVGDTESYFHDGSSPTIEHAILRHGGEAAAAQAAYVAASLEEQDQLLAFLGQLRVGLVGEVMPVQKQNAIENYNPAKMPLNSVTIQYDP